ncbi:hypothetical protein [Glaciecola sp. 1036]|uniref:hypothetical protein n=1 Tax=Alteromonadaceae TaxID=72275 RepID=UPI003CFE37C8
MSLIIKGQLNLANYFAFMVLATLLLVSVVVASFTTQADKATTAYLIAFLASIAVGLNMKVITMLRDKESSSISKE